METEGCPYLDLGTGCRPSAQVLLQFNLTSMHFERLIRKDSEIRKERRALCLFDFQARQSRFYFPILIQEMYPAGGGQRNVIIKRTRDPQMYIFIL